MKENIEITGDFSRVKNDKKTVILQRDRWKGGRERLTEKNDGEV